MNQHETIIMIEFIDLFFNQYLIKLEGIVLVGLIFFVLYYNFIKGQASTWDGTSGSLDTKTFPTQGIDVLGSRSGDLTPTTFTLTVKENND